MLLIPFVENAFKHSKIEDLANGWIRIDLRTGDDSIEFIVENSLSVHNVAKDAVGGIGLHNVRRQLELLYPGRHSLEIMEKEGVFLVRLRVEL
jgi:LytS/YehU family sensor histidine kinase